MNRLHNDLSQLERDFIDMVYVQLKSFQVCSQLLKIDLAKVRQLNTELEPVWRPITKIRNTWKTKQVGGDFWDFYYWCLTAEKRCNYCGITKEDLEKLHSIGLINKRKTRGKSLEIDRKQANEKYGNIDNLTYSCYWCNNAKTDTFTEEEFKIIGKAISQVWEQRLGNDNR